MATTRERIVAAAARLLMRQGYAGSGLKQISEESRAPFGSVYHHFPQGKQELAAEALRWAGGAYQQLVEAVIDGAADPVAGVAAAFDAAATALEASDFADACPIATVALEVASTNEELRVVTAEIFDSWIEAGAVRLGALGVDPPEARELALLFVAALEGGFLLARASKDAAPMHVLGRYVGEALRAAVDRPSARRRTRP